MSFVGAFIDEMIEGEDPDADLAPGYPRLLALRDAASYQQLIRDALGNQAIVAAPTALWQADETSGPAEDLVGTADLTITNGATRVLTTVGNGTLDRAMKTVDALSQNWCAATGAAVPFTNGEAFALVGVFDFPAQVGNNYYFMGKRHSGGAKYLVWYLPANGHPSVTYDDALGHTNTVTTGVDHIGGGRFVCITGPSILAAKIYLETSLASGAEGAFNIATELANGGRFSVGATDNPTDGPLGSAVLQEVTHLAYFTGAAAEAVLANRVALAARLLTL